MEAIARKNFDLMYIEAEYNNICFCLVTRDGWYYTRITAENRAEAVEKFLKGVY